MLTAAHPVMTVDARSVRRGIAGLDGWDVARALKRTHRCPPNCSACSAEEDEHRVEPLSRFSAFIQSSAALRIGRAYDQYATPFPLLSEDAFEQWLLQEAVMCRYREEMARLQREAAEKAESETARKKRAADELDAYREGREQ